jgi:molecular chaperone GrpE
MANKKKDQAKKQPEKEETKEEVKEKTKEEKQVNAQENQPAQKASEADALKAELEAQKDAYLRLAAEFDNYKRREKSNKEMLGEYVKSQTLKELLGAVDGFERVLAADCSSPDYVKGVEMTIKSFTDALKKLGLEEINPEGETFDVNLHQAVMRVEDDSLPENTIVEVLQKGYKVGENILRYAMVKVANS